MTSAGERGDGRVNALREEIAHTRADLGHTVEALAAKADVKARARASAHEASVYGRDLADRFLDAVRRNRVPLIAGAAIGTAVVVLTLVRRRWEDC